MAAKYKICPHCSHKIKPTTTFCIHCGKDLRNIKFIEYNNALVAESSVSKTENVPEVEKASSTPVEQSKPISVQPVPAEAPSVTPVPMSTVANNNMPEVVVETKPVAEPTVNVEVITNNTVEQINPIKEPVYTNTVDVKQEENVIKEEPVVAQPVIQVPQPQPEKPQAIEPVTTLPQAEISKAEPTTQVPPVQQPMQDNASERQNPFKNVRRNIFSDANIQNTPTPIVEKEEIKEHPVVVFEEPAKPEPVPMEYSTPPVAPVEPVIVPTPEPVAPVIAPAPVVQAEVVTEKPITQSFAAPTHEVPSNTPVQKPKPTMEMQSFVLEIPPQPVVENRTVQETIEQTQTVVENDTTSNLVQNNVFEPQMQNSPIYEQKAQNEAPTPSTQPQNNVQEFDEFMVTDNIPTTNTETTQNDNFVPNMQDIEHTKSGVVLGKIPAEEETEEEKDIFFKNEDTIREEPYDARKDGYYNDVEAEIEEEIKHTMADSTKKTIIAVVLSLVAIVIFALWKGYI